MGNELNLDEAYAALADAACAVIERWDSPAWKDLPHTGESINALRRALAGVASASAAAQGHAQQQEAEEIERLRKDAERYRWLKAHIQPGYEFKDSFYYLTDEDTTGWDPTIDAAMAKQKAKSGE